MSIARGISVASVTYSGETPENLERYFSSMAHQSRPADEIILVLDGVMPEPHLAVIERWRTMLPIKTIEQEKAGLAPGLNRALQEARYDVIMRCDTDDSSYPERFERLETLLRGKKVAVASGSICEHVGEGVKRYRVMKERYITRHDMMSFFRSPINHNNCCYRRETILKLGGYPSGRMEDMRLWIMLLTEGEQFYTTSQVLLDADAGNLNNRRKGADYRRAEWELLKLNMRRFGGLGFLMALPAYILRTIMRWEVMNMPRRILYQTVMRRRKLPH